MCALVSGASLLLVHPSPNRIYSRQSLLRGSASVALSSVGKREGNMLLYHKKMQFREHKALGHGLLGFLCGHIFYPAESSECLVT